MQFERKQKQQKEKEEKSKKIKKRCCADLLPLDVF